MLRRIIMSVVSTVVVKGNTYTVTWAADQSASGKSFFIEKEQGKVQLEWSKPTIKLSGKTATATIKYKVNGGAAISQTKTTYVVPDDGYGWYTDIDVDVEGLATIAGTTVSLGTVKVFSGRMGCRHKTVLRQRFATGAAGDTRDGRLRFSSLVNYVDDPVRDGGLKEILEAANATVTPVVRYRLYKASGTPNAWTTAQVENVEISSTVFGELGNYDANRDVQVIYDAFIDNMQADKVYEVESAILVPGRIGGPLSQPNQWAYKRFTAKTAYNNIIAVGDEIVAPIPETGSAASATLAAMIGPAYENNGATTNRRNFVGTATHATYSKTGAKIADLGALIRAIPSQGTKNTLLVISIGMHDVIKVSPSKMVSSTTFKSTLKSAISAFLAKNPKATVALMPAPYFNRTPEAGQNAIDFSTMIQSDAWTESWTENAPNILGSFTSSATKIASASKLESYTGAMLQLVSELSTADRKRVVMGSPIDDPAESSQNYMRPGYFDYADISSRGNPKTYVQDDLFHLSSEGIKYNLRQMQGLSGGVDDNKKFYIGDVIY